MKTQRVWVGVYVCFKSCWNVMCRIRCAFKFTTSIGDLFMA